MAAETIHHPNASDPTEGYSTLGELFAAVSGVGFFPYLASVDMGHSGGGSGYRLGSWTSGAATGSEAEWIQVTYADTVRGTSFDVLHRFHLNPGVVEGSDPVLALQGLVDLTTPVPAFSTGIAVSSSWLQGILQVLRALGAWDADPTFTGGWITATEGPLSGLRIVFRLSADYNPSAGEYSIGIGQGIYTDYYVCSDLDTERVVAGGSALGEVLVNSPQVVLSSGAASAEWGSLSGSAEDIAGFLDAQEAILQDMRDSQSEIAEDVRAPLGYSILSPLSIAISNDEPGMGVAPDAGVAETLGDIQDAWPERPESLTPGGNTILVGAGTLPAVVVGSTAFLASLTSSPAIAIATVAAVGMAAVVAYAAIPAIQTALTSLASSLPAKLQTIADQNAPEGDAYALVERIADALERQADAVEAIEVLLTGGEEEPVLADHIKSLSENLLLLAESKSIVKLAAKGMVATAHVGHLTVVEEETEP